MKKEVDINRAKFYHLLALHMSKMQLQNMLIQIVIDTHGASTVLIYVTLLPSPTATLRSPHGGGERKEGEKEGVILIFKCAREIFVCVVRQIAHTGCIIIGAP